MNDVLIIPLDPLRDLRFVYMVRNHPQVRKWMVNSKPFSYEQHLKYWEKERANARYWYVIWRGGKRVGYLNFRGGKMDIAVHPRHWGNGIATEAVRQALEQMELFGLRGGAVAEIKEGNARSKATFRKNGVTTRMIGKEASG